MASDNETIRDIVHEMRTEYAQNYFCEDSRRKDGEYCDNELVAIKLSDIADRIEAAWKREKSRIEADALATGAFVEAARWRETKPRRNCKKGGAK